jgi:D-sedoheptulose 7-phosphate isomerase
MTGQDEIIQFMKESRSVKDKMLSDYDLISKIILMKNTIVQTYKNKNKLLIAGNGGSAADAQHFAAEMTGRYKLERQGLAAIALTTDTSAITAISNDYGYNKVFSRQLEALGNKGDTFIGISTSGNSENIIETVNYAKDKGIYTIGLLGKGGGNLRNLFDLSIVVPSDNTPRIQENHIFIIHSVCELVEKELQDKHII